MLAGGGTGGHLFPMMAVAQELERLHPGVELRFVGTERGLEARVLPRAGYALDLLPVKPLKGGGAAGALKGLGALPLALWRALALVRRWRPQVVVSAGGYAAGPVTLAAWLLGVPTALMEQNAMPGLTNRLLGRVVRRCFLSMGVRAGTLPEGKCEVVGNPVRRQMVEVAAEASFCAPDPEAFMVFITGGSGGAGPLNARLPVALRGLPEEVARRLVVVHQAGRGRAEPVREAWRGFAGQVEVVEFVEDMAGMYQRADLVICRAGATTLAELFLLGQPALLIPFAGAADNHQEENARAVVEAGGAVMVREAELDGDRVAKLLVGLMNNPEALEKLSGAARSLGRPEAGAEVARRLLEMVEA